MEDYEQRYFVRQHALEEAYRVRGQFEETPEDFLSDLTGSVLLLLVSPESAKPAICRAIEPGAAVRVYLPRGVSQERTRFPFSSILEVLGSAPQDVLESNARASSYLNELVKASRRIRRNLSAHELARQCREGQSLIATVPVLGWKVLRKAHNTPEERRTPLVLSFFE